VQNRRLLRPRTAEDRVAPRVRFQLTILESDSYIPQSLARKIGLFSTSTRLANFFQASVLTIRPMSASETDDDTLGAVVVPWSGAWEIVYGRLPGCVSTDPRRRSRDFATGSRLAFAARCTDLSDMCGGKG
jgi:hypothetical protein